MDIHRLRSIPYQPSAINSIAFTHTTGYNSKGQCLKVAIGRANGTIEIWNPSKGAWIHETTIHGGRGRSVEGLVWTKDPDHVSLDDATGRQIKTYGQARLFSIGYSAAVTEWDLLTGYPRRESSGVGGEVWCLAAQPIGGQKSKKRKRNEEKDAVEEVEEAMQQPQNIVAGCADGTLVLLSTADDDLTFSKYIARASKKNARALSVIFQNQNTVIAGFADSTIRVYDIRNGTLIRNMSLGASPTGGPKEKLVWAVECLKDGTIVSGDSSGEVVFWDGKTYGQLQRIHGHEADVLCLTASEDGTAVFSGGIDRRTCVYQISGNANQSQRKRWMKTTHRRFHQHDVKAMARYDSSKTSVIVSGGLDTTPILIPLRDFATEHHRVLPFVPQISPVVAVGRLVSSWKENEVTIWEIHSQGSHDALTYEDASRVVGRLILKAEEDISCVSINNDQSILAVSSSSEIKLFKLRPKRDGAISFRKIENLPKAFSALGARVLDFSPDGKWLLAVTPKNEIRLTKLQSEADGSGDKSDLISFEASTLRRTRRPAQTQNTFNGSWGSYDRKIIRPAFSSNSQILAVTDIAGYTDIFTLMGEDGTDTGQNSTSDKILTNGNGTHHSSPSSSASDAAPEDSEDAESNSSSDSDSNSDSDNPTSNSKQKKHTGAHWKLNRSSKTLPRLPSPALIFSFRPTSTASSTPPQHEERKEDDRLCILTAQHTMHEFLARSGTLSTWSRRNPSTLLPSEFKLQRDRATGCIWDVSSNRERIWIHSATWLAMFDLSVDFDRSISSTNHNNLTDELTGAADEVIDKTIIHISNTQNEKKTNRLAKELKSKKRTTGAAGSKIKATERPVGIYEAIDSDVEMSESHSHNHNRQRLNGKADSSRNGNEDDSSIEDSESDQESEDADAEVSYTGNQANSQIEDKSDGSRKEPAFYITQRYRSILGVVPLASSSADGVQISSMEDKRLEVALIERPFWDLDLPPRFVSKKDREEK